MNMAVTPGAALCCAAQYFMLRCIKTSILVAIQPCEELAGAREAGMRSDT